MSNNRQFCQNADWGLWASRALTRHVSQHCDDYPAFSGLKTRNKIPFWCVTYVLSSIIFMLLLPAEFCNAGPGTASQSHFKIRFKLQASLWLPLFLTERRPTRNLTNEILPVSAEILYRCWQSTTLSIVAKTVCSCFWETHIKVSQTFISDCMYACVYLHIGKETICMNITLSVVTGRSHCALSFWHRLLASS